MDAENHNHLLRMAIADALRELNKNPRRKVDVHGAVYILENALNDVFSNENMEIIFPKEEELPAADVEISSSKKGRRATGGGYVELKMIPRSGKLHGPYAYKRWREGGRLCSKYIGKVKT